MGLFDFFKKKSSQENCLSKSSDSGNNFYFTVSNKYTAFGGLFAEGKIEEGSLNVGDKVWVYQKNGECRYNRIEVARLINSSEVSVNQIQKGQEGVAIVLSGLRNFGDIGYGDIISKKEIQFEQKDTVDKPSARELPEPKTYNDTNRTSHINMATNDLCSIFGSAALSGNLDKNREWIRNVGQDLFDAHGFSAMQEVFINVKNRYPMFQEKLSSIWDGVGGWAD